MSTTSTPDLLRTQALILAGGQGERLFPLTLRRPKPAIPFGGIFRIVDFTMSNCLRSNLKHVALLTQYRHEELHAYIRRGWSERWSDSRHSGQLQCLPPSSGKHYRGTADAVFQNLELLDLNRPEYVLVLSGDHVYHMDYREILAQHVETQADVTIATVEHPLTDAAHFGVVEVDREFRIVGFEEKPLNPRPMPSRPERALISMGLYAFKTDVLIETLKEHCERRLGHDFGHHIIPSLIGSARVYAYDFRDAVLDEPRYWRDIGTIDSYYNASMDLAQPNSAFDPYVTDEGALQLTRARVVPGNDDTGSQNARVHGNCHVSKSVISRGVCIREGANVQDCVLMPGVTIGRGAAIRRAIVEEGVQIPANFRVGWDTEEDRKRYTISRHGVVVVSETPRVRDAVVRFKPFGHRYSVSTVA